MNGRRFNWWWVASFVTAVCLLAFPLAQPRDVAAQGALDQSLPQRFMAFAVNLSDVGTGSAAQTIQIEITRWSTDAERDRLLAILKEKGESALLSGLQKLPKVGNFRTPDSLAYDLHFARQHPGADGGRRIFIATDRYIQFWEAANHTRSMQYPFTFIEMRLDNHGQGEGKLSIAVKVTEEDNQLVLENYASQPVMLTSIKPEK